MLEAGFIFEELVKTYTEEGFKDGMRTCFDKQMIQELSGDYDLDALISRLKLFEGEELVSIYFSKGQTYIVLDDWKLPPLCKRNMNDSDHGSKCCRQMIPVVFPFKDMSELVDRYASEYITEELAEVYWKDGFINGYIVSLREALEKYYSEYHGDNY